MAKFGGAWKVAYADFVTAMMAFFLVMWIISQDQDKKEAIVRYFNNPLGVKPIRASKLPESRGSLFTRSNNGDVTAAQEVALSSGRKSYSLNQESSPSTSVVGDHLFANKESIKKWEQVAHEDLQASKREFPNDSQKAEQSTVSRISSKLKTDVIRNLPADLPQVYRSLIYEALDSVNWQELAEDIVESPDFDF